MSSARDRRLDRRVSAVHVPDEGASEPRSGSDAARAAALGVAETDASEGWDPTSQWNVRSAERAGAREHAATERVGLLAAVVVFALSRFLSVLTGSAFSMYYVETGWQLLDAHALRADPFGSVLQLHTQPPLLNLFVGIVLRWSPLPSALSFQLAYVLLGLLTTVLLYLLLVELGVSAAGAAVVTCVVMLDPSVMKLETFVNYEYIVGTLLVATVLAVLRYARTRSLRWFATFVALTTAIVMLRSLYHPLFLVASVAIVLALVRPRARWRALLGVALVAFAIVGGWMLKNEILFSQPTMSSWFGFNMEKSWVLPLPKPEVDRMVREGKISPAVRVVPFSPYSAYARYFPRCHTTSSNEVLAMLTKRNGSTNFNAKCWLPVYDRATHDALAALEAHPGGVLRTRELPALLFLGPHAGTFTASRSTVTNVLDRIYGPLSLSFTRSVSVRTWAVYVTGSKLYPAEYSITLGLALLGGLLLALRGLLDRRGRTPTEVALVLVGWIVVYTALVSVIFEIGENDRFRAMLDPLVLGIALAAAWSIGGHLFRRLQRRDRVAAPA